MCAALTLTLSTASPLLAATVKAVQKTGVKAIVPPEILGRSLSLAEALNITAANNGEILQEKQQVEAQYGVAIQIRAIVLPKVLSTAAYQVRQDLLIEQNQNLVSQPTVVTLPGVGSLQFGGGTASKINNQAWSSEVQIVQSLYEGGQMLSALRTARLLRQQAMHVFQTTVTDVLLRTHIAYDDALLGQQQIEVQLASIKLLTEQLDLTKKKRDAGALTDFEVLRAEAELGNAQPALATAENTLRIAKQNLVTALGYDLPATIGTDIPLTLTTPLEALPYDRKISEALTQALADRSELNAHRDAEAISRENIITARAGYLPSVQAFAGYEMISRAESRNVSNNLNGGIAGVQGSWAIFDGALTYGKVKEARALSSKSRLATEENARQIETQVRTAWSNLDRAKSLLVSQKKNIEVANESLRLATVRYDAGTVQQIDVLNAQTTLTQTRTNFVQALHDYAVARAQLLRATGEDLR